MPVAVNNVPLIIMIYHWLEYTALQYSDIGGLEQSIDTAYNVASQRLFDIFFEKFGLLVHLKALKNYMFLGHGDFAEALMDSLSWVY